MNNIQRNFDLAKNRQERGLTQQELAGLSGLTSRTIQRIERGEVCGFLCMKLAENKVLDLDKPLHQYLKKPITEFVNFSELRKAIICLFLFAYTVSSIPFRAYPRKGMDI